MLKDQSRNQDVTQINIIYQIILQNRGWVNYFSLFFNSFFTLYFNFLFKIICQILSGWKQIKTWLFDKWSWLT